MVESWIQELEVQMELKPNVVRVIECTIQKQKGLQPEIEMLSWVFQGGLVPGYKIHDLKS